MELLKKYKPQIKFHFILNLVVVIFITFSSYYNLPLNYISDYLIYFIHLLILQFTVFGFLYILSINKYVFYIIFGLMDKMVALFFIIFLLSNTNKLLLIYQVKQK